MGSACGPPATQTIRLPPVRGGEGWGNLVREVADATRKHNVELGVYLSPADLYQLRTNPTNPNGYYGNGSEKVRSVIPTDPASFKTNPTNGRKPPLGFKSFTYELAEAEKLVASIRSRGAKLAVPGLVDLSDLAAETDGVARIVLESVQELLLKLALQMAREDYETRRERQSQGVRLAKVAGKYAGRAPDTVAHQRIVAHRAAGQTIRQTAELTGCSLSQVKRIWAMIWLPLGPPRDELLCRFLALR